MPQDADARRRTKIRRMVRDHPSEVMEVLLDTPFWPQGLEREGDYQRLGDDDQSFLGVTFSQDGDVWPNVFNLEMAEDPQTRSSPRYRTYFGGGQSLRTRAALCILAKAIAMDNADRPQRRTPPAT